MNKKARSRPQKITEIKSEEAMDLFKNSRVSVFLQSVFQTIITIGILGGLGYYMDKLLKTWPLFFIIGVVLAYPLTQIYLLKKIRKYSNKKIGEISKKSKK